MEFMTRLYDKYFCFASLTLLIWITMLFSLRVVLHKVLYLRPVSVFYVCTGFSCARIYPCAIMTTVLCNAIILF